MSAEGKPVITLHWLDRSRAHRILWLIYELDIPTKCDFKLKIYKRDKNERAPPELKNVHPLGKSPVLEVEGPKATKSITIAESGAIIDYLCGHFGQHLIPRRYPEGSEGVLGAETESWIRYLSLMQYGEGSLMTTLIVALINNKVKEAKEAPFFVRPLTRAIGRTVESSFLHGEYQAHFSYLESLLASSPDNGEFFCGSLSAVDFLLIFPLQAAQGRTTLNRQEFPKIYAFVERCEQRPAYKQAVQKIKEEVGDFSLV